MDKPDLIKNAARLCGHSERTVRDVLDATSETVHAALAMGDQVRLFGLGKLSVVRRPAKTASNFGRGDMLVPARNRFHFKPSNGLVAAVNAQ